MESWYKYQYLYDLLKSEGYNVKIAHPPVVKAIAYAKVKADKVAAGRFESTYLILLIPNTFDTSVNVGSFNTSDIIIQELAYNPICEMPDYKDHQKCCLLNIETEVERLWYILCMLLWGAPDNIFLTIESQRERPRGLCTQWIILGLASWEWLPFVYGWPLGLNLRETVSMFWKFMNFFYSNNNRYVFIVKNFVSA